MSNRRRPNNPNIPPLRKPPVPSPGHVYGMVPVVVPDRHLPGAIDTAKRIGYDKLIADWGEARRSQIWWSERRGLEGLKAYRAFMEMGHFPDADPEVPGLFESNPNVTLVTAWCIVVEPVAVAES